MVTVFEPHGEFEIEFKGAVIHMRIVGSTNIEQIERVGAKVDRFLDSNDLTSFGILVELGEDAMLTYDAVAKSDAFMIREMERGLCAVALVVNAVEFRDFIIGNAQKLYDSIGLRWEQFENANDARKWLESQIAGAESGIA